MSVSSAGSSGAYNYLQSILQQQSVAGGTSSPIVSLLDAFYPASTPAGSSPPASTSASATGADGCGGSGAQFSPDTLGALISLQASDPIAAKAQSLFAGLDSNGDSSISQSEFENAFGAGADTGKVDGLFNALDADGDGSVSQDELTSAVRGSQAHHHRHHHAPSADGADSSGRGGGLDALMSASSGASTRTANNSDGSTTTTITYADGSSIALNSPAAATAGAPSSGTSAQQAVTFNMLEKLIAMQAQMISSTAGALAPGVLTSI
jgi:hypothetical protein